MHLTLVLFMGTVDGQWGPWGLWSECTATCGGGEQQRSRVCRQPSFGGDECLGDGNQIRKCSIQPCEGMLSIFSVSVFVVPLS